MQQSTDRQSPNPHLLGRGRRQTPEEVKQTGHLRKASQGEWRERVTRGWSGKASLIRSQSDGNWMT